MAHWLFVPITLVFLPHQKHPQLGGRTQKQHAWMHARHPHCIFAPTPGIVTPQTRDFSAAWYQLLLPSLFPLSPGSVLKLVGISIETITSHQFT
jgi:hypothetical protein